MSEDEKPQNDAVKDAPPANDAAETNETSREDEANGEAETEVCRKRATRRRSGSGSGRPRRRPKSGWPMLMTSFCVAWRNWKTPVNAPRATAAKP